VVLGRFDGGPVALEEVARFQTTSRPHHGLLRWDLGALWERIRAGLDAAGAAAGTVDAVGVDAWGVDYGLLGPDGSLLGDPVSYRDPQRRPSGLPPARRHAGSDPRLLRPDRAGGTG
jgi:rhamnulokinase